MTLAAGTRLGPYEIVSAIGAGGMGEVYKGRDTRLARTVAITVTLSSEQARAVAALNGGVEAQQGRQYDVDRDGRFPHQRNWTARRADHAADD